MVSTSIPHRASCCLTWHLFERLSVLPLLMRWKTCLSSCRNFVPGVSLFSAIRCQLSIKSTFTRFTYKVSVLFTESLVFLSQLFDVVTPATLPMRKAKLHSIYTASTSSQLRKLYGASFDFVIFSTFRNCNFDAARVSAAKFADGSSRLRGSRDQVRSCEDGWFARPVRCAHCKAVQVARLLASTIPGFNRWLFILNYIPLLCSSSKRIFPAPCALDSNETDGNLYVSILSSRSFDCFNCFDHFGHTEQYLKASNQLHQHL